MEYDLDYFSTWKNWVIVKPRGSGSGQGQDFSTWKNWVIVKQMA